MSTAIVRALALALALCAANGAAMAGDPTGDSAGNGAISKTEMPWRSAPAALVVNDERGIPILTIDTAAKTITVPDGVDVNDAAKKVFDIMVKNYLPQCTDAGSK